MDNMDVFTTYQYLRFVCCGFKPYCSRKLENQQDHLRVAYDVGNFDEIIGNNPT